MPRNMPRDENKFNDGRSDAEAMGDANEGEDKEDRAMARIAQKWENSSKVHSVTFRRLRNTLKQDGNKLSQKATPSDDDKFVDFMVTINLKAANEPIELRVSAKIGGEFQVSPDVATVNYMERCKNLILLVGFDGGDLYFLRPTKRNIEKLRKGTPGFFGTRAVYHFYSDESFKKPKLSSKFRKYRKLKKGK